MTGVSCKRKGGGACQLEIRLFQFAILRMTSHVGVRTNPLSI
jgi:hypothetical protein